MGPPQEVTQLLVEWGKGNQAALDELMPLVYAELRRMAGRYMGMQTPGHTMQATALIHEAYIRLAGDSPKQWENRAHFFGAAAKAMRHVLVDYARAHLTKRRGGNDYRVVALDEAMVVCGERLAEIVALDDALTDLSNLSPRQSQVVELRYFGGLNVEETAEALKVSSETVMRDWRAAKSWLYIQLKGQGDARSATT
jgi:RNA polymerase sigma factor (TIGR02999 family)